MSNNLKTIKLNLYKLFWKYPYLKNKNYNYLYFKYCLEFHKSSLTLINHASWNKAYLIWSNHEFWAKMPAMESISRCKRKLALKDEIFRPTNKKVIESRIKQSKEILESVKD